MIFDHKLIVSNYLKARNQFLTEARNIEELKGNDNIIGRIGEYIAIEYYRSKNLNPIKANRSNQKGWDIVLQNDQYKKVSVRIITSENQNGKTTPVKLFNSKGVKTEWDILMVILLDYNEITKIGIIERSNFEVFSKGKNLITQRSFFAKGNLFDKYGEIISNIEIHF